MSKKDVSKINGDNAKEICSRIREESSEEAEAILGKAHRERERILSEASKEAEAQAQAILSAAEKEIAVMRERIICAANMEKRRILLEAKSLFIADIVAAVKGLAQIFRGNPAYVKFLKEAVSEGIRIVDDKKAQILYSHLDEAVISQLNYPGVDFKRSDFDEIGLIVKSADGRILFDNRFSARLKRSYDEIYIKTIKEDF